MQQGDYSSSYYHHHLLPPLQNPIPNPNPNPNDVHEASPTTYASAPPFGPNYLNSEYPNNYSQNPDPPTAPPSYVPPPNPNYQSFNNSPPFPSYLPPPSAEQQYPPAQQPSYYSPYDQHQTVPNYIPPPPPQIPSNLNSNSSTYPSQIPSNLNSNSSTYPSQIPSNLNSNSSTYPYSNLGGGAMGYDASYESSLNRGGGSFLDESPGRYGGGGGQNVFGRSRSDLGSDYYDKRPENNAYDGLGQQEVYAYQGGKVEPYGARGTGSKSFTWAATAAFDDYGRSISSPSGKDQIGGSSKVVKAVPKMDTQQDIKNGVQKFRVKLLAESGGQSTMDVLCQIGLDGIRILDPNASRMLRIYPLETVTRSEVTDSSTFTFWSKSSVDIEPRRIRLQSNSYTTNTILDIVTAATFQLKEMGKDSFRSKPSDPSKVSEQLNEKKKGFTDWVNLIKPGNEEKDHWVPDEAITKCAACGVNFGAFVRKHHCRNCGDIFCDKCTQGRIALTVDENAQPVRVCDRCLAEVTQRLSSAKESASKPASLSSHEDLAKKLQEEMERNRKASSGTKSFDGSSRQMKEVACPTCTVHLQVQVPTSGSETIECGVCQHPFLVSAH